MYKKHFSFTICVVLIAILLVYLQSFAQVQDNGEFFEKDN